MTLDRFLQEFKLSKDKLECVKKHIKDIYVPFEEKIVICNNIINSTCYVEIDGERVFKQNTPSQYMLYALTIISKYTDINIDFKESSKCFNELNKINVINIFNQLFSEYDEYKEFEMILKMTIDDLYRNERNIITYLDNKINSLLMVTQAMIESMDDSDVG